MVDFLWHILESLSIYHSLGMCECMRVCVYFIGILPFEYLNAIFFRKTFVCVFLFQLLAIRQEDMKWNEMSYLCRFCCRRHPIAVAVAIIIVALAKIWQSPVVVIRNYNLPNFCFRYTHPKKNVVIPFYLIIVVFVVCVFLYLSLTFLFTSEVEMERHGNAMAIKHVFL